MARYFVVFKDSASQADIDRYAKQVADNGGAVHSTFDPAVMKAFTAELPNSLVTSFSNDQAIDYIELDQDSATS